MPDNARLNLFHLDPHVFPKTHATLDHKCTLSSPFSAQTGPKPPEKLQRCFIQLHHRNILTQADPRSISKHHAVLCVLGGLGRIFQPTIWVEGASFRAVEVGVSMYKPWIAGNFGTRRSVERTRGCVDGKPRRPDEAGKDVWCRRAQAVILTLASSRCLLLSIENRRLTAWLPSRPQCNTGTISRLHHTAAFCSISPPSLLCRFPP